MANITDVIAINSDAKAQAAESVPRSPPDSSTNEGIVIPR